MTRLTLLRFAGHIVSKTNEVFHGKKAQVIHGGIQR